MAKCSESSSGPTLIAGYKNWVIYTDSGNLRDQTLDRLDGKGGPSLATDARYHSVVDRLVVREGIRTRLADSVETALRWGGNRLVVMRQSAGDAFASKLEACSRASRQWRSYLRAAQAYMLISMPTCTSTIFGVFQVIRVLPGRYEGHQDSGNLPAS